ncbi:urease accessory protein UreF [Mycolicibacterium conceptionense]|uniref:Urease accessory protein UreF n=1 Tax=Mycolicibacterium conceptionense TaxID=451644 RepID=A0A0U1DNU9_9MYCO|nr:urease accessory protein UreF [Mycolicibacterium conceptionense]
MSSLATLLTLADSRLPTGGHVHSGGVEEAVTSGLLVDLATLRAFLVRRIRTSGVVAASIAVAVRTGALGPEAADAETDRGGRRIRPSHRHATTARRVRAGPNS